MFKGLTSRELRRRAEKARRRKNIGYRREDSAANILIADERKGLIEMQGLLSEMVGRLEDGSTRAVDLEDLIDAALVAAAGLHHRWPDIAIQERYWSEVWAAEELLEQLRDIFNRRQDVKDIRSGWSGVEFIRRLNWVSETKRPLRATSFEIDAIKNMLDIHNEVVRESTMMNIRHDFRLILNGRKKVSITLPKTSWSHVATRDLEVRQAQVEENAITNKEPIIRI